MEWGTKTGCAEEGKGCHQAASRPPRDGRFSPPRSGGEEASALTSGLGRTTRSTGEKQDKRQAGSSFRSSRWVGGGARITERLPWRRATVAWGFLRGHA